MILAAKIIPNMLRDRLRYECQQRGFTLPSAVVTVRRDPLSDITMVRFEVPGYTALNVPILGDLNDLAFSEIVPRVTKSAADYFAKTLPPRAVDRADAAPLPEGVWRPPQL